MRITKLTPLTTQQIAKRADNKRAVERFKLCKPFTHETQKQARKTLIIEFCNMPMPNWLKERKN